MMGSSVRTGPERGHAGSEIANAPPILEDAVMRAARMHDRAAGGIGILTGRGRSRRAAPTQLPAVMRRISPQAGWSIRSRPSETGRGPRPLTRETVTRAQLRRARARAPPAAAAPSARRCRVSTGRRARAPRRATDRRSRLAAAADLGIDLQPAAEVQYAVHHDADPLGVALAIAFDFGGDRRRGHATTAGACRAGTIPFSFPSGKVGSLAAIVTDGAAGCKKRRPRDAAGSA